MMFQLTDERCRDGRYIILVFRNPYWVHGGSLPEYCVEVCSFDGEGWVNAAGEPYDDEPNPVGWLPLPWDAEQVQEAFDHHMKKMTGAE